MKGMKKARVMFNAFVDAAESSHVYARLYTEEKWSKLGTKPSAKGAVMHAVEWKDCTVDQCRVRFGLAVYMAKKL